LYLYLLAAINITYCYFSRQENERLAFNHSHIDGRTLLENIQFCLSICGI